MLNKSQAPTIAELYRLKEQIDLDASASWERLCVRDAAIGKECRSEGDLAKLLFWLRSLPEKIGSDEHVLSEAKMAFVVGFASLVMGFAGMTGFLLGGNYVWATLFFALFVMLQIVFCIFSVIIIIFSKAGNSRVTPSINPVKYLLSKRLPDRRFYKEHQSVIKLVALRYGQEMGVLFTTGAILAFIITQWLFPLVYVWGATEGLDEGLLLALTDIISFPWAAAVPEAVVSADLVEVSRLAQMEATLSNDKARDTAEWVPFLRMSMCVYALFPRLILWLATKVICRRALGNSILEYPGSDLVLTRMNPQKGMESPVLCVLEKAPNIARMAPLPSIYELISNLKIPHARLILDQLYSRNIGISDRPAALAQFIKDHRQDLRFRDDFKTLRPILDGAGIIYFVDASYLYEPEVEKEMEILRWTGRPGLAVIESSDGAKFAEESRDSSELYLSKTLFFYDHITDFQRQSEILEKLEDLNPAWKGPLSKAIHVFRQGRLLSHDKSGSLIADLIVKALSYHVTLEIPKRKGKRRIKDELGKKYRQHIESYEFQMWRQIIRVFNADVAESNGKGIEFEESNLFSGKNRFLYGAGPWKRFLAFLSWLLGKRLTNLDKKQRPDGTKYYVYRPPLNAEFPFILLARGIHYHKLTSMRAGVIITSIPIDEPNLDLLGKNDRRILSKLFAGVRNGVEVEEARGTLSELIGSWCKSSDKAL